MKKKKTNISMKAISLGIASVIVAVGVLIVVVLAQKNNQFNWVEVQPTNLQQTIRATGKVQASSDADLAFERSGRVKLVTVDINDHVKMGDVLVSLEDADLQADLLNAQAGLLQQKAGLGQYQAALQSEQAKLNELVKGTRQEELQIAETSVRSAEQKLADAQSAYTQAQQVAEAQLETSQKDLDDSKIALTNAQQKANQDVNTVYTNVLNRLNETGTVMDEVLYGDLSDLFSDTIGDQGGLVFSVGEVGLEAKVEQQRVALLAARNTFFNQTASLTSSAHLALDAQLAAGITLMNNSRSFLVDLNHSVDVSVGLTADTTSTYKGTINSARSKVDTSLNNLNTAKQNVELQLQLNDNAISSAQSRVSVTASTLELQKAVNQNTIVSAQNAVNDAKNSLNQANDQLRLKQSGSTEEQIQAQQARVDQARANIASQNAQVAQAQAKIENINAQIAKTILIAPIDGIITRQEAKVGELITASALIVGIISEDKFEIVVSLDEEDVAKVAIHDFAHVTFDAFGPDEVQQAEVVKIDPAETVIDGVSTFEITLHFIEEPTYLRSGLSTDVDIITFEEANVVVVPLQNIKRSGQQKYVEVLVDDSVEQRFITTGIIGDGGMVEVLSGLTPGDKLILNKN